MRTLAARHQARLRTRGAHTPKAVYMHPQGRTPFQSPSFQRWENALGWLLIDECVGVIACGVCERCKKQRRDGNVLR